jgi:hypothetical protein
LSRTVRAIPPRADAPTTAIESGAKSGRRSIGGRAASPATAAATASLTDHPPTPRFSSARGDDQPLDLGRALPDPVDPQLAQEALGGELAHVAAAAEDLDDAVGAAPGRLGREQLGERRLGVDDLRVGAGVGERAASRVSSRAADASAAESASGKRHALEVVDPLAELDRLVAHSTASVSSRSIAPGSARRCGSAPRRTTRSSARRPADAAEDGRRRHADVLEDELRVAVGERVGVVRVVLQRHAGRVVVDEEERRRGARRRSTTRQWKIMKSVSSGAR